MLFDAKAELKREIDKMARSPSQKLLEQIIEPVVQGHGYSLWGLEFAPFGPSAFIRVFVDAPNGITLDDCAFLNEQIGAVLDVEDPIPRQYRLEISSPGLDRVLFKPEQYQSYIGHELKIRLDEPVEGQRNYRGQLVSATSESIEIEQNGQRVCLPIAGIKRARLVGIETGVGIPKKQ